MDRIWQYIIAIGEYKLDLDWKEICDRVPDLRGKALAVYEDCLFRSYLESLEYSMGCFLRKDVYEDAQPGQAGPDLTLELQASRKEWFIRTMEQLLRSLEKYWKEHHLPRVD
jgi:hypothetical protein